MDVETCHSVFGPFTYCPVDDTAYVTNPEWSTNDAFRPSQYREETQTNAGVLQTSLAQMAANESFLFDDAFDVNSDETAESFWKNVVAKTSQR